MAKQFPYFFVVSTKKIDLHHPAKELWPNWVVPIPATLHRVVSAIQRMKNSDETLAYLRAFIDALELEYLLRRKLLDEEDIK